MSNVVRVVDTLGNQPEQKTAIARAKVLAANNYAKLGALAGTVMVGSAAHAEGVAAPDMSPIITMINGLVAVVGSVGMAVLSVYATAKVFKWVKTAF